MHSIPVLCLLVPLEEGELGDPEEIELALGDHIKLARNDLTECTECGKNNLILVCADKHYVALFKANGCIDRLKLLGCHELCKGAVGCLVCPTNVGKTLCADSLCMLCKLVDLFSCKSRSAVLCNYSTNTAAILNC